MNIEYRKKESERFFKYIESGESFYIVGAPSAGKTRFIDHLMGDNFDAMRKDDVSDRNKVQSHYLGSELSEKTWLARVDMNRLRAENDWGFDFFELLLNTLLLTSSRYKKTDKIKNIEATLAKLDSDVIQNKDALEAHRIFEMAVNMLCQSYGINICFLFDEFDEVYKMMPKEIFAYLRAIRDANKYRVSYALFLRNIPEKLRNPIENESFYELVSRNRIGLGPFSYEDATQIVIRQLEERHDLSLSQEKRKWVYGFSGGHPSLIQALLKLYKRNPQTQNVNWYVNQAVIKEECRKIENGLLDNEIVGLLKLVQDNPSSISIETGNLLLDKGLLKLTADGKPVFFSPLFEHWLSKQ